MPEDLLAYPAWRPYRAPVARLPRDRFPEPRDLQTLLGKECRSSSGQRVTFVSANQLPAWSDDAGYEREIGLTGRVSTRPYSVHDLCNALVWSVFPRLKATLNERHLSAPPAAAPGRRGPVRDAVTGFDECGAIVVSPRRSHLESLARHDWTRLFGVSGERWPTDLTVLVVGHGTLEMLWAPYKAITVRSLLLHTPMDPNDLEAMDRLAAKVWRTEGPIGRPADLCPLPIMGIPGWWPGEITADFWADRSVFRPPRPGRSSSPIYSAGD